MNDAPDQGFVPHLPREVIRGLFIASRMKVDQDTFGLNKGDKTIQPVTSEK